MWRILEPGEVAVMDLTDSAKEIREGEALDEPVVKEYLRGAIPGLSGEMSIRQFPSGFSNLTYLVTYGDREMVLRRPPFGKKAKTAHDMHREFRILSALRPVYPYCPMPLAYCDDETVMGCPVYVMERIKGIILRKDMPKGLALSAADARQLCENLLDVQVAAFD